jgi:hypothetical protein
MSKSLGNFIILEDAIARWGADATRFALADAGDGLEDANFERETADNAILRLTPEQEWAAEMIGLAERGEVKHLVADACAEVRVRMVVVLTLERAEREILDGEVGLRIVRGFDPGGAPHAVRPTRQAARHGVQPARHPACVRRGPLQPL